MKKTKLTPYQSIFYYEWLSNPLRTDYNIVTDNIISGELNIKKLFESFKKIVNDNFVFDNYIVNNDDGIYWQRRESTSEETLFVYHDHSLSNEEISQLVSEPFNLEKDIPARAHVIQIGHQQYRVIFVFHHILVDGVSTQEFWDKLSQYYNDEPYELPPFEIQAQMHQKLNDSYQEILNAQKQQMEVFWREALQDVKNVDLTFLKLSTEPPDQSNQFKPFITEYVFNYDEHIYKQVKTFGRKNKITPYLFGQLVMALLLNKMTAQSTIPLVYPIAFNEGKELLYGAHINTLPIVYHFNDNSTLQSVIQEILTYYKNVKQSGAKYLPIYDIMQYAENANILDVAFVQTFVRDYKMNLNGMVDERANHEFQIDLSNKLIFEQEEHNNQINYRVKFNEQQLDKQLVEQFVKLYQKLFIKLLNYLSEEQTSVLINEIELLDEQDKKVLIHDKNQTQKPFESDKIVAQLFEAQCQKTPFNTAVIFEQTHLSYSKLNTKANQLAHYLQEQFAIKPNDLVGLYLDRSEQIIVTILAVLKAGAAYVPMDPTAPDERNKFIMQDAKVRAVLTQAHYVDKLNTLVPTVDTVPVDDLSFIAKLQNYSTDNSIVKTTPNDLAYVIYTSGTTGNPKGTLIEQHNINRLIINANYVEIEESDRIVSIAGYQFDASTYEIFGSLLNGAAIVIATKESFLDLDKFNQLIAQQHITNFFATSTFFNTLVDAQLPNLAKLRYILAGGEALSAVHVNKFLALYPHVKLVNGYGPTETTTFAVTYLANQRKTPFANNVPIGVPLTNTTLYILDQKLRPVPLGCIGELYIGGAGVGRGYLNNAEMTNKVFINNPFQTEEERNKNYNGRIYKTGDLVRYLSDGNIEYIGRNDFQVKIRGFRIELAEIETHLMMHPQIKQAIVLALTNQSGYKYLAAYYVAENELDQTELNVYLQNVLPEYMVPSTFIHLLAMPVNINGKIDHRALPEPILVTQASYVAPSSATEQTIVADIAALLGFDVSTVSVTDDFFRLGGNSILAIKLSSKLTRTFDRSIRVADIFTYRTAQKLAQFIDKNQETRQLISAMPVTDVEQQLLSFAQERLWFIDSYEGGSNAYNVPLVFKLARTTDVHLLEKALYAIIERHEVLRSLIKTNKQGFGYQQVINLKEFPWSIIEQSCSSKTELDQAIYAHVHRIFVLSQELPISVSRYQFAGDNYLSIVIHHIAFDGWSTDLFLDELYNLYQYFDALSLGNKDLAATLSLPTVEVQYKDFALWQRNYLKGDLLTNQLNFWQQQLAGFEPLNLPTDYPRPRQIDYSGHDVIFEFDEPLSQQIRALASELNVSVYSVLLSGFYLLLSSFSNQKDVVIGSPIAGRHYPGIENTMGFFVNTLALRKSIDPKESLKAFILQTSQLVTQAQQYQDLPFERLVDALAIEKDASRNPIFQVMFGVQSFGSGVHSNKTEQLLTLYKSEIANYQAAKFDMTVMLDDSQSIITGLFNYASKLYRQETIEHYITIYRTILQQFTQMCELQQPLANMRLVDVATYQKLVFDKNETTRPYAHNQTVAELFEAKVQQVPNNTAVIFQQTELSYQEVNHKANQLARYLQEHFDIKANDLIGLYLDRSEQIVICILAILKAGGAYVPMDPNAPDARNQFIMQDAQLKAVLTTEHYCEKLKGLAPNLTILAVEQADFQSKLQHYTNDNLAINTTPNDLAYVIYTSGTTGNPKGTLIEQHNINRLVINANFVEINHTDRLLSISGYQFDASTYDIFGALLNGATVVIAEKEVFLDLDQFNQLISDKQITNFFATTTFFNALVDYEVANLSLLNYILVGGEALSARHVNKFRQLYPNVKLVNGYGPTETTTFAVTYLTNLAQEPFTYSVPIGKALTNTSLYILDEQHRPVPMGAIGELYIGGAGVGRGYLHNPELTDKVFILNPFQTLAEKAQDYNGRIYKTGDLVRYLADGNIDYIGRNDFQVKIRGFRIELAEIETCLISYDEIQQAAVLALNNSAGAKYLAAYYVAKQPLEPEQIVAYLKQSLPEYMIPAVFIHLDAMPMNMNGKLDRKALPVPQLINEQNYVAPSNETETVFCQTFANILGLQADNISVEDDFFKLGGDSISSIQLANRIKQALNYYLSIKDIFNLRTVKALSEYVINHHQHTAPRVEAEQGILTGNIALSAIQQWFFKDVENGKLPDYQHWNQAFLLKVPQLDIALLKLSVQKLFEYHDMLRVNYHQSVATYQSLPAILPFSTMNVADWSEKEIHQLLTDWQSHFVFDQGLLCHIGYLTGYADNSARIHIAVHHLNIDAVSWRIIKDDLQAIYQFFSQQSSIDTTIDVTSILGNKGSSYRQWVNKQEQYSAVIANEQELPYWQNVLTNIDDYHQYLNQYRVDTLYQTKLQLTKPQTSRLLSQVNKVYGTEINDILLTALAQALKLVFNGEEHYILLEGHGREALFNDLDINNTVGWFTSMYPVKLIANNQNIINNVATIKDSLRDIPHHGVGYGCLIGYIKQALPAICFNYLGQFDSTEKVNQWQFSNEDIGVAMSPNNRMTDFLSINGGILDEQLQFAVAGYVSETQGEALVTAFTQQLNDLIDQLASIERSYLTHSDVNKIISPALLDSLQADQEIEAIYPANSLQQGFIYHAVSQGELDNAYRIQMIWDYYNSLNADVLRQAWQLTQQKFPSLRLRFSWTEELVQIIDKQSGFAWQFIDLSEQSQEQQLASINKLIKQDEQMSYDLTKGQLFRVYLIQCSKEYYRCLFNNHHAILDGWSVPVLLNDVHQNYLALLHQKELVIQPDNSYLAAQSYLQSQTNETALFWQQYLNIELEPEYLVSLLKTDLRHINLAEHKYVEDPQEISVVFTPQQCDQLKAFCKSNEFTLNALVQYCWHQQLSIFGNTNTTVVGMTVSGRNLPIDGIEQSVGLYINTLPVILEHTDGTVIDNIKTLQTHINNVNNHSHINLIEIQKSGTRLFNSLFVFENYPITQSQQDELQIAFQIGNEKLDYPLGIVAFERANELTIKIKYAGELFVESAIERVLAGIKLTLTQLVNNPTIAVKALNLLTEQEYAQLIVSQSNNVIPFERNKLVSQLFEEQVQKSANNIAVVYEGTTLTYQSLNEQANQLANYLRSQLSIQPDDLIALYLDKSHYMIVSILAVLKSGAAYVPIAPNTPAERVQLILNDTKAKGVLTHEHYRETLTQLNTQLQPEIIAVDHSSMTSILTQFDRQNLTTTTQANHLAYVIYTSGTTGLPKGVMIEHHGVANLATVQQATLDLAPCQQQQKNVLWYSNYIFDAHAFEIYNALLNGHRLHILSEDKRLDFMALSEYIRTQQIDFAFIPPALLEQDELLSVPVLTVGGEAVSAELVQRYCQHGTKLVNVYGPSETTVWAMAHRYQQDDLNTDLGQAIKNVTLYVLDEYLRPVPPGVIGELYIGGAGVGRGYLNNPEGTHQSFIANPFQTIEEKTRQYNDRIYKTGDLVRYLPNGHLEYIGRNDFQVKIRGFRIELGEIETQLLSYPSIKQVLILALTNHQGNKYLAAYYVADQAIEQNQLISHLQQTLPEYMVPAVFIHLNAMPVTVNGKIDRKALPVPNFNLQESYIAPSTDTEQRLVTDFAELLGLKSDSISVIDDFFRLGGNSILAIKLSSKIAKTFERAVRVSDIFTYRTVQALAKFIDDNQEKRQSINIIPVTRVQEQQLSFAQERLWFIDCYESGSNAYNIPLVFKLLSNTNITFVEQALRAIVQRQEVLRSLIKTNEEGVGYQEVISLEIQPLKIDFSYCESQAELDNAIHAHIHKVFILSQEFPISIRRHQLADDIYMSIVIHHIAFDGWSIDLFIDEFSHFYHYFEALALGDTDKAAKCYLAPIEVQYKDFALWQRQYLQGDILTQQLQFWQQQLADFEPLNLPTDFVRPQLIDYSGSDVVFELDTQLSQQIRSLASELNVSVYSVLLSGFYLLLSSFSNQKDIVIGSPIAGRHYQGTENTMGFFVNTLALRKCIEPEDSLKAFILQTSQLIMQAQQYQDLPFERLVEVLSIEKDMSRHPIFQVMFGVQSFGAEVQQQLEDNILTIYHSENTQYQTAKFDMTVMLDDSKPAISGLFNYATKLFKQQTIEHYIVIYQSILKQFTEMHQQQQPLTALRLVDNSTYQKLIFDWNDTRCEYPKDVTMHQLFERQVLRTPNNLALIYENDRLTYQELNEQANQLAHYLRENFNIQPDDLVALCLERCKYMLVSILAILKAGGAYVPMDPNMPEDRISYMLADTKAKVVLTTNLSYEKVNTLVSGTQIALNLQSPETIDCLSKYPTTNPVPLAQPNNLAYVIYTSGTTGNPKGVMLQHQGAVNRIIWMHNEYPITEQDHILQKTNYTFDVSVWELFWANWYGACIVFAHSDLYKDNVYLAELIESEQITVLHFVPSMLVAFVETLGAQPNLVPKVQGLKYLFCSGEALNLYEVKKCHVLMPNCQVHNLYGPTEATVDVLYYDCNNPNISQVLIGKPIANTSAYVLNEFLQPVPIGGIGELYVGGDNVARGYLNNIPLSNERFIANPFQTDAEKAQGYNGRIYKTGDLVRALADGNIEYLGRNDFQVKIRGFRIELGEIEARLTQYNEIKHSIVVAHEQTSGSKYLVAYYLADKEIDSQLLQLHLQETLPSYMVPSAFIYLAELPITSNGKLNRRALPKPDLTDKVEYVAPNNSVEKTLCQIFAKILKIPAEEISMQDSFFRLGGNSILAMMLNNRINDAFNIKMRLVDILSVNTIQELATKILTSQQQFNPIVELCVEHYKPQIFMIHPGLGGCDVYLSLANKLSPKYLCYGVDSYNLYHDNRIDNLKVLAEYYLSHISKIAKKGQPITLLGWSLGGNIALEIATQLEKQGIKNIKVYLLDTWLMEEQDIAQYIHPANVTHAMNRLNLPAHLSDKVELFAETDNKLVVQPLSAKLKYTQVVLFKATQINQGKELTEKYALNNIDKYLQDNSQLEFVEIDCDHYDILSHEQTILAHIL